jgi:signal transduction histidine kinase/ligand-binding sensor domain-containing protein
VLAHRFFAAMALVVMGFSSALALDPARDLSQYGHTTWKYLDGFGPGTVWVIGQTTDGYLWLGTPSGLMRFDGVSNVRWKPPGSMVLPDERIRALLGTRDGALWIGTMRGLSVWKDERLTTYAPLEGKIINALVEDRDGTVWAAAVDDTRGWVCAIRVAGTECHGQDGRFGDNVLALQLDASGALWIAGRDRVWKWMSEPPVEFAVRVGGVRSMAATPDGGMVLATQNGLWKILGGRMEPINHPKMAAYRRFNKVMCDRDGALWVGAFEGGLLHLRGDRFDAASSYDGAFGNQSYALFEDREGNIWVGTREGLNRFRPVAARIYSRVQGVVGSLSSVLATSDGSVWASSALGVYRIQGGEAAMVRESTTAIMMEDRRGRIWAGARPDLGYFEHGRFVKVLSAVDGWDAIAEDLQGHIWVSQRDGGLLHLLPDGKVEWTSWAELGATGFASTLAVDPVMGGIWAGFWSGDLKHVRDGKVRVAIPAIHGSINHVRVDPDGTLWLATEKGVTRIKAGRALRLDDASGLPCNEALHSLDDGESLWIYLGCGLARIGRKDVDAWAAAAERNVAHRVSVRLLDHWDGVRLDLYRPRIGQFSEIRHFTPRMTRARDGSIWLATLDGAIAIEPSRIPFNGVPPPVKIENIIGDATPYEIGARLHLPPLVRNLQISYTGLSLTIPEKMRFRHKLEGRDTDWQDAGNRRRAFYTDLPPGTYRFRVIAANNSGVWNERGDSLEFSIEPAWWQTNLFRVACVAALALLIFAAYRGRMARLRRQLDVSLEARVNERLRISRDLHDTLLQSFHGLLLRFQTALEVWPSPESREILEKTIDQAAGALTEGRNAVQGLRSSATESNDLAEALRALAETLATERDGGELPALSVEVRGTPRPLHPIVRDEVFRIAAEAMRNAFRHSAARNVEVETRYDERQLCLRVRDDGNGMDPAVAATGGREGHFGLSVMRERANVIGGQVTVWSAPGAGTEVELTVPGSHAYAGDASSGIASRISGKLYES